jgi:hypothetical protein
MGSEPAPAAVGLEPELGSPSMLAEVSQDLVIRYRFGLQLVTAQEPAGWARKHKAFSEMR